MDSIEEQNQMISLAEERVLIDYPNWILVSVDEENQLQVLYACDDKAVRPMLDRAASQIDRTPGPSRLI